MKDQRFYSLFVLAAAILWGTTGTAQSFAPPGASPLSVGAIRLLLGGTVLLVYSRIRDPKGSPGLFKRKETLISAAAVTAFQLLFFAGVLKTGVATGTMVTIGSAPIFAGIYSFIRYRDNPGRTWLIATAISVLGCVLLIGGGEALETNAMGILLNLAAGFSYAMYIAFSKVLLAHYSPEEVTGKIFALGSILVLPILLTQDLSWLLTLRGMGTALHLGIVTTALAYLLFSYGLARISYPSAVTLSLAEPITAALLGVFLLGESLTTISTIGLFMVFGGLVILSVGQVKRSPQLESGL